MNRLRAALPLLVLVAIGVALFVSGGLDNLSPAHLASRQGELLALITHYPWVSRLAYVGFLAVVVATAVPASPVVTVAGGLLFGIAQATALSTVGVVLGSLLLFTVTRLALGEPLRDPPQLVERLRHGFAHHPVNYTLFLRLVPGAPWGPVTVALGWLRCSLRLFIGATAIGSVATTLIESTVGAAIGEGLKRGEQHFDLVAMLFDPYVLMALGGLALLALLPLVFGRLHHASHHTPNPPRT